MSLTEKLRNIFDKYEIEMDFLFIDFEDKIRNIYSNTVESELEKCKNDPVYFYENYFLVDGRKPELNHSDKIILRALHSDNIVLTSSRHGKVYKRKVINELNKTLGNGITTD